jgi:hypothetical protein
MGVTDTQSYSLVIRDALFDALATMPMFASFTKRKCKQFQVQNFQVPYLGAYIIREQMSPDGDPNAGTIRFTHNLTIGYSVIIQNQDPIVSEQKLDAIFWAIMNRLWTDQYLMNLLDTRMYPGGQYAMADNTRIEGVLRGERRHIWGNTSLTNEMPIAELQYDVTLIYRTGWWPIITDDFLRMYEEVVPMADDGTVPPPEEVERVQVRYEFPPATTTKE